LNSDPLIRELAKRASPYPPQEQYILFVLSIEFAFMNTYAGGKSNSQSWRAVMIE